MNYEQTKLSRLSRAFAHSHRKLSSLHRERQVLPYYDVSSEGRKLATPDRGIWTNVAEHCFVAAQVTDILAEALRLPADIRTKVNAAAWIHDSGKKVERFWQQLVAAQLTQDQASPVIPQHDLLNKIAQEQLIALQLLSALDKWEYQRIGVKPDILEISQANIPTLAQFKDGHATLAEKILWFADACVSGTAIVPIPERFERLVNDPKNGAQNRIFSESYSERFDGASLYEVQLALGRRYVSEFAPLIGMKPEEIFSWLQGKIQQRMESNQLPEINGRIVFNRKVKRS